MAQVDLHLHTTASDGRLTPAKLVELVGERRLQIVAITDHDSTEGLAQALEAAKEFPNLTIIPGIELSSDIPGMEVHVLGYFIDYSDERFQKTLREFREGRVERARKMVSNLSDMGLPVDWERVLELADGAVGRPHIAQAMVEKGYVSMPQEAFVKYIGRNGPAYAERPKLSPKEAARLITGVGGLPVLAHPLEIGTLSDLDTILPDLKAAGLTGMEVYCGSYTPSQVETMSAIAHREGLIACGGSDYHALGTPKEVEPGQVGPPLESADRLFALAGTKVNLKL